MTLKCPTLPPTASVLSSGAPYDIGAILAKNPFVAAPLDGYSDPPFRLLSRRFGAGLCFSEMVPAMALVRGSKATMRLLRVSAEDHPIAIQVEGADPKSMAEASVIAEQAGADFIDVNAGCPSRRITNGGAGSALLSDMPRLGQILEGIRKSVTLPVTLKFRSGPTQDRLVINEIAAMAHDLGLAALTLHPRTRAQAFKGRADWSHIATLKGLTHLPVIGNGDVETGEDGVRLLRETGCDGVMVGRGAVGQPWIFTWLHDAVNNRAPTHPPQGGSWRSLVVEHFDMLAEYLEDEKIAAMVFRKHLSRYSRGMQGATELRRSLGLVNSRESFIDVVDRLLTREFAGEYADD